MSAEMAKQIAEYSTTGLELLGTTIIVLMAVFATGRAVVALIGREEQNQVYASFRRQLAAGILLGLELLVAADIIATVAVKLTLHSVAVLAIIVLIRTFLSFTLELEKTGRWPWQQQSEKAGHGAA
jgi:uncharacterized membrane protein